MSVMCFVCHLPILSHQTPRAWEQGSDFYHDDCLRCDMCGLGLAGPNLYRARRHADRFLCDLHYSDVVAAENSDFAQQLREFKRHALGCAVARRKSSTTLVFPTPPQACPGEDTCDQFPHRVRPTPGYWIECTRQSTEAPPEKLLPLEEVYSRMGTFELTSFEQETFERHFYATEHWNYFTTDDELGPVILSLKQEVINNRDHFRIMVRTVSYSLHGLVPASCLPADRYNREDVVRALSIEIGLHPHLQLGQLPSTPDELLKLDQVFIKSELKVGIIFVREGQTTEEEVLDNNENSHMFDDFLQLLGDQVRLKGFDRYKGGLDTVHDLTGTHSVYTCWRGIEVMFHVSTMLPYEKHDPQKLQRKRHIGNDIVCVVFLEAENTDFSPSCIKSHFLHTFVVVQALPDSKETPTKYNVSIVSRDEVGAYKPYLWQRQTFHKEPMFREWLLTKIVNGERASYSAPKFARMQDRTRSQLLEDIVTNLQNHAETGQMPKPYRRGSWRPIGHMRPSSPLLDSVRDLFEGYEGLAKDFTKAFKDTNALCDIVFNVGQGREKVKVYAVRAMLAVRSRVFQEMLYGIASGLIGTSQSPLEALNRAVTPTKFSKSSNFLQVPETYEHSPWISSQPNTNDGSFWFKFRGLELEASRPKSAPSSPMVMRAFSRLARWDWSGKSKNHLGVDSESLRRWTSDINCNEKRESKQDAAYLLPRLSMCADIQKVDRQKLMQSEFNIIEFDPDTFETLLEYLHTGSCPLTCRTIPGLICAAEHFDLPELLQACFHHAKQHLRINIVCTMMTALENYYWRYTAASELINMILVYVDARATQVFECKDFYELSESMVQMILSRELNISEVKKFQIMLDWAHTKVNKVQCRDSKFEFRCTMERLTRDLKLYKISPTELIKVVLPTKAIRNERILETLMHQANSGMYRIQPSYLQECRANLQGRKESRADIMLYGGMMSFDRRDSILPPEPNFELQRHDSLLEEYVASIKRQESEEQELDPLPIRQEIKRRISRPDFRPLLHRQETKRRESRQLDKPLIQHQDSQGRPRRDSKWWMSRQESKDDSARSPESRHSQRRESKLYESKFYIWRHRQESKSQDEDSKGSDPKLSQRRDSRLYTWLHRQDSKTQDEDSPRSFEGRQSQRRDSRIHMWLHRQSSKTQDEEGKSDSRTAHRRDSRLFWFHKHEDNVNKHLGKSEDSEDGPCTSKAERKHSTRRDSKVGDNRLHGWFSRRFSKPDEDEVDLVNDDTDTDAHDTTVELEEEAVPPDPSSRSTQRRDSKLYTWLFKQQNSKSNEEEESHDLQVRSSAEKKPKPS